MKREEIKVRRGMIFRYKKSQVERLGFKKWLLLLGSNQRPAD
tara:strand:+ start:18811 stop:18936 length:126 start_codon:yes stop_codon:yes gene_type:complete